MSEEKKKSVNFLSYTNLKGIIRDVFLIIMTIAITNYCHDTKQNKDNYIRLTRELDWNLSELKDYDEYLTIIESYLISYKSLAVKGGQGFNPMFKSFPMRFPFHYWLVQKDSDTKKKVIEKRFDILTKNYIINELKNSGFLYQLKEKEYIKFLDKMSESNWLVNIIAPINDIFTSIDNLPKIKEFSSEKAAIEQKLKIENACNSIISKVKISRELLNNNIEQLKKIIAYTSKLHDRSI